MRAKVAIVTVAIFAFAVTLVFPPWVFRRGESNRSEFAGYHFLASGSPVLPELEITTSDRYTEGFGGPYIREWKGVDVRGWVAEIDTTRLVLQSAFIVVCTLGLLGIETLWAKSIVRSM